MTASLVDAHAHLHPGFAEEEVFGAARTNFLAARHKLSLPPSTLGVLVVAECPGQDVFPRLCERAASGEGAGWTIRRTLESDSVLACRAGIVELVLVAGRQIRSREGLEVLALGSRRECPDGLSIDETLAHVRHLEALAIVPWGFGKWWFGRGRLLAELLEASDPEWFFLGDNGGRPRIAAPSRLFGLAQERGIRILPGTDPLPLPRQAGRVGSYGCVVAGEIDLETPAAELKKILRNERVQPAPYGDRAPVLAFVRDQLAMQLGKHVRKPRAASRTLRQA